MSFFIFLQVQPSLMKILQGLCGLKSQVLEIIHIPPYGISDQGRGIASEIFQEMWGLMSKCLIQRFSVVLCRNFIVTW